MKTGNVNSSMKKALGLFFLLTGIHTLAYSSDVVSGTDQVQSKPVEQSNPPTPPPPSTPQKKIEPWENPPNIAKPVPFPEIIDNHGIPKTVEHNDPKDDWNSYHWDKKDGREI